MYYYVCMYVVDKVSVKNKAKVHEKVYIFICCYYIMILINNTYY